MAGQGGQELEIVANPIELSSGEWLLAVGFNDPDLLTDVESVTYEVITDGNRERKEVASKKDFFECEFVVRDLEKCQIRAEVRFKTGEIVPVLINLKGGTRSISVVRSGARGGSDEGGGAVAINELKWNSIEKKGGKKDDDGGNIPKSIAPRRGRIRPPSGMFYLVVLGVVMVLIAVIAMKVPWYVLPIVVIGSLLSVVIIGAFRLREDERLSQSNFLTLVIEWFKRLPLLKSATSRKALSETEEQEVGSPSETRKRPEVTDKKLPIAFVEGERKKPRGEVLEASGEKDGALEKTE